VQTGRQCCQGLQRRGKDEYFSASILQDSDSSLQGPTSSTTNAVQSAYQNMNLSNAS